MRVQLLPVLCHCIHHRTQLRQWQEGRANDAVGRVHWSPSALEDSDHGLRRPCCEGRVVGVHRLSKHATSAGLERAGAAGQRRRRRRGLFAEREGSRSNVSSPVSNVNSSSLSERHSAVDPKVKESEEEASSVRKIRMPQYRLSGRCRLEM